MVHNKQIRNNILLKQFSRIFQIEAINPVHYGKLLISCRMVNEGVKLNVQSVIEKWMRKEKERER